MYNRTGGVKMLLSDFLKRKREQLNLTQRQLAKIIGVSQSYINMLEIGNRRIGRNKIDDFAKALGVTKEKIIEVNKIQTYTYNYDKRAMARKQVDKRIMELDILINKTEKTLQYLKNAREVLSTEVKIKDEEVDKNC